MTEACKWMNCSAKTENSEHSCLRAREVHWPQQLEGDAEVIAEVEVLLHVDDVVEVVFVLPFYDVQDLQLNQSLVMKPADL